MSKRRDNFPSIKKGLRRRSNPLGQQRKGPSGPRLSDYGGASKRRGLTTSWAIIAGCALLLAVAVAGPLWLRVVGSIVPDRFILAYAPERLQPVMLGIDVNAVVPTPIGYNAGDANALLEDYPTPLPTITPTVVGAAASSDTAARPGYQGNDGYVQPTAVAIAPTATVTPASALPVDPRAQDGENASDLSNVENLLTGFDWEQQGLNNCGPASLKTLLSYWGETFTEEQAAAYLKPTASDPNVRPDEMASYAEQYGYETMIRVNGTRELMQDFIRAGYPVMIETGYDPEPETVGWTSHYLTLVGFTSDVFIAMDTYRRPNWEYDYAEIDYYWRQFNRKYLVFHRADQRAAVESIILNDMRRSGHPEITLDEDVMYELARLRAQNELIIDREDPFGWYNLGHSLVGLGRYEEAVSAFNEARRLGLPERFPWYQFEMYEAYMQMGQHEEVIAVAEEVLGRVQSEEAHYYLALALAATGDTDGARRELNRAIAFNRNYTDARIALDALGDE